MGNTGLDSGVAACYNLHMNTKYENLSILPYLIGETVATQPYKGIEIGNQSCIYVDIEKTEALRLKLTYQQIEEFADWVDRRCRYCYENNVDWFMKIVKSKNNAGRDQLYIWVSHWLSAYLKNPEIINRK